MGYLRRKLKSLLLPTPKEPKHGPEVMQALYDSVERVARSIVHPPEVGLTPTEHEALKQWVLAKQEKGFDLRNQSMMMVQPDNDSYDYWVSLSFDSYGDLKRGTWYVKVPLKAPGSGLDITALGALTDRPEPAMEFERSREIGVTLYPPRSEKAETPPAEPEPEYEPESGTLGEVVEFLPDEILDAIDNEDTEPEPPADTDKPKPELEDLMYRYPPKHLDTDTDTETEDERQQDLGQAAQEMRDNFLTDLNAFEAKSKSPYFTLPQEDDEPPTEDD